MIAMWFVYMERQNTIAYIIYFGHRGIGISRTRVAFSVEERKIGPAPTVAFYQFMFF